MKNVKQFVAFLLMALGAKQPFSCLCTQTGFIFLFHFAAMHAITLALYNPVSLLVGSIAASAIVSPFDRIERNLSDAQILAAR